MRSAGKEEKSLMNQAKEYPNQKSRCPMCDSEAIKEDNLNTLFCSHCGYIEKREAKEE